MKSRIVCPSKLFFNPKKLHTILSLSIKLDTINMNTINDDLIKWHTIELEQNIRDARKRVINKLNSLYGFYKDGERFAQANYPKIPPGVKNSNSQFFVGGVEGEDMETYRIVYTVDNIRKQIMTYDLTSAKRVFDIISEMHYLTDNTGLPTCYTLDYRGWKECTL